MKTYQDLNDYELLYMVSENDECAKNLIFDKYKPLITRMAYKYYKTGKRLGLELDDLIQEGYFGLFQALSNFSENKDCLFYTYLLRSISTKMYNLCVRNDTKKNQVLNNSISLNENIGNDSDTFLIDMIEDKNSPDPWSIIGTFDFYKVLKDYIYGRSLIQGSILELKLNGFTNSFILELFEISKSYLDKTLLRLKKDLKRNLSLIEKSN